MYKGSFSAGLFNSEGKFSLTNTLFQEYHSINSLYSYPSQLIEETNFEEQVIAKLFFSNDGYYLFRSIDNNLAEVYYNQCQELYFDLVEIENEVFTNKIF